MDQITFMGTLLDIDGMVDRLRGYIELRSQNIVPGVLPIKSPAFFLLREAFLAGEFAGAKQPVSPALAKEPPVRFCASSPMKDY